MMNEFKVEGLKWDDLVMIEAMVTRTCPNARRDPFTAGPGETAWTATFELVNINLLWSSTRQRETRPAKASTSI